MSASMKIDTAVCDNLIATLEDKGDEVVRKYAFKIQGESQMAAPVDTSALMNSAYTKTSKGSTYQGAATTARNKNPNARIDADISEDVGLGEAIIAYPMEYAVYVELGTSKMPARAYLTPAAESNDAAFKQALKDLIK